MSVINRIEIVNFLNTNGEREQAPWEPKYRHVILPLRGQSTAINMGNGCGKTSLAEAVIGMLSRDQQLLGNTRSKMAPAKAGVFSHVRVEFLVVTRSAMQRDVFVDSGQSPDGETWVFGMCGYRGAGEQVTFYYHPGSLEQSILATRTGNIVQLLPNAVLQDYRKIVPGFDWGVDRQQWRERVTEHISLQTLLRNVRYQKMGAGDKSAELFKVKPRAGEPFHIAFFYEVLAPELLSGLMDEEGEEGEFDFEDTVLNTIDRVLKAKRNTDSKRDEVARARQAVDAIKAAARKAATCREALTVYHNKRKEVSAIAQLLRELAMTNPLPGVPRLAPLPTGLAGNVFPYLVIEPGKELRILDQGLSELLGREVKHVNEFAGRHNIRRSKPAQLIELSTGPSIVVTRGGHGSTCYTLQDACDLLKKSSAFGAGITLSDAVRAVEDATAWFETKADTHPFRPIFLGKKRQITRLEAHVEKLEQETAAAAERRNAIEREQRQMQENEAYYRDLLDCSLFSPKELEEPLKTKDTVTREYQAAQAEQTQLERKLAQLEVHAVHWRAFRKNYGDSSDPQLVHSELLGRTQVLQEQIKTLRRERDENFAAQRSAHAELAGHQQEFAKTGDALSEFNLLAPLVEDYRHRFGERNSAGLDQEVVKTLSELTASIDAAERELARLREQEQSIAAFRTMFGDKTGPDALLRQWETERERLLLTSRNEESALASLKRRRSALDHAQVASGDVAESALEVLLAAKIAFTPAHTFLATLDLLPERRRTVLSSLSALLFAPVVREPGDAARAAKLLHERDLPIPIFLADAFATYARDGAIETLTDPPFAHGLVGGVPTRAVECLLDPTLVEREKRTLNAQIAETSSALEMTRQRLAAIRSDADAVQLARRAAEALRLNVPQAITRTTGQLETLRNQLPGVTENASIAAITAIQAMQAYVKRDGETGLAKARLERDRLEQAIQRALDHQSQLVETGQNIARDLAAAEQELPDVYPGELRMQIDGARTFTRLNGPTFMANAEQERRRLENAVNQAEKRRGYAEFFDKAERYLKAKRDAPTYLKELGQLERQISTNKTEVERLNSSIGQLQSEVPALEDIVEDIDLVAAEVLAQYRHIASLESEISLETSATTIETGVGDAAAALRCAISGGDTIDSVQDRAVTLRDALKALDLKADAAQLRDCHSDFQNAEQELIDAVRALSTEPSGLAPTEREQLSTVQNHEGAAIVLQMEQRLTAIYEKERSEFTIAETAEAENRQKAAERMNWFIRSAETNLDTFKKVVSRERGRFGAHFRVEAKMATKEEAAKLVDSILETIETVQRESAALERKGVAGDKDTQRVRQRELIRNLAYRQIFRDPKVTYVNRAIRPTGEPHAMNPTALSNGQRMALSLMWMVRLADFAITKEVQRLSSSRVRGKALAQSESILIIDGLFSDLSAPDLIESAMSGIEDTRGRFQLIGLIHIPQYQNDFQVFPVLLYGKERVSPGGGHGWVQIEEGQPTAGPHLGSLDVARLELIAAAKNTIEDKDA